MNVSKGRKSTPQKIKEKNCAFPGCGVLFMGLGKAKYCEEHRKAKYRKELYKQNDNKGEAIIHIEHDEVYAKKVMRVCELDGCDCEFEIILLPRLFEYPRYCVEHRNTFKRNHFIKQRDKVNE